MKPAPELSDRSPLNLSLHPRHVAWVLAGIIAVLVAASTLGKFLILPFGPDEARGLRELTLRFYLDNENNIPSWYSSLALLACGGVLAVIARAIRRAGQPFYWHWVVLSGIFVYLAIDEATYLHEILIVPIRRRLDLGGFLYFAWVIPGGLAVGLLGLTYVRFLRHQTPRLRRRMLESAGLFLGGALGMEMVCGALADGWGFDSLAYILAMTCEETLEMAGVAWFLVGLLQYLQTLVAGVQITLPGPAGAPLLAPSLAPSLAQSLGLTFAPAHSAAWTTHPRNVRRSVRWYAPAAEGS